MSKIKQSIAVQRQIPEHIRENYPAFVEFVKVYYDFLEQTQAQQLEKIRDIDTTLEEFIDRFKSELAKNIPIELAANKRELLKHIREFYLSRGSEESFKFLFKALYAQEAQLFYPSTQILRASDGKWQQDTSIFVELDEGTDTLYPSTGKFIKINTNRKVIQTYVENVQQYSSRIFEVFIERAYANEIRVDAQVTFTDTDGIVYSGKVLSCPAKVKVYKSGKGFRVGSLYKLKTSLGDGCLVKVTKIDSVGGIKAVQIIRFGLDYKSTFYSYLSAKDNLAFEYLHPLDLGRGAEDVKEYTASPTNGSQTFNVNYLIENGNPLLVVEVIRNNAPVVVTYTATNNTTVTVNGLSSGDIVKLYGVTTKGVAPARNITTFTAAPNGAGQQVFPLTYTSLGNIPQVFVEVKRNGNPIYVTYTATDGISVIIQGLQAGDTVNLSAEPSYNEYSGGFVDYGFASKQTYFEYDSSIPVQKEVATINGQPAYLDTRASDRFFADTSYVGDIVQQFYTDATGSVFDDDLAIIQVDIGATAVYPGYYRTSDGFVSDEMYIQDGKYYQAFSYVIRVEEELRKYADVVRALIHPAGMKLFAEYNIFNAINVAASLPILYKVLQFADSLEQVKDLSYNYDNYIVEIVNNEIRYLPAPPNQETGYLGAAKVYTQPGKAALFPTKNAADAIVENFSSVVSSNPSWNIIRNYNETISKLYQKNVPNDSIIEGLTTVLAKDINGIDTDWLITRNYSETIFKSPIKNLSDSQGNADDNVKHAFKNLSDAQALSTTRAKDFVMGTKSDTITERFTQVLSSDGQWNIIRSYDETISKLVDKPFASSIPEDYVVSSLVDITNTTIGDSYKNYNETWSKLFSKNLSESQANIDVIIKEFLLSKQDQQANVDFTSKEFIKNLSDDNSTFDNTIKLFFKNLEEIISNIEDVSKNYTKPITELQSVSDTDSIQPEKPVVEVQPVTDSDIIQPEKNFADLTDNLIDGYILNTIKNFSEFSSASELYSFIIDRAISETANALDNASKTFVKSTIEETIFIDELFNIVRAKLFDDFISTNDYLNNDGTKNISESASTLDSINERSASKGLADPINILTNGRVILSPYDSGDPLDGYFELYGDYQAAIQIS